MRRLLYCFMLLACSMLYSQIFNIDSISIEEIKNTNSNLINKKTYTKFLQNELAYLLTAENSLKQGFGYTLSADKSNLKVNGLLSQYDNWILSMEADLSSTDGVYLFNGKDGSKKGRVSFNAYRRLCSSSTYKKGEEPIVNSNNFKISTHLLNVTKKYKEILLITREINSDFSKKRNNSDAKLLFYEEELKTCKGNIDTILKLYTEKLNLNPDIINTKEEGNYDRKIYIDSTSKKYKIYVPRMEINKKNEREDKGNRDLVTISTIYKLDKVNEEFLKLLSETEKLRDSLATIETEGAKDQWFSHKIMFLGINPYYSRESFTRYLDNEMLEFDDRFIDQSGDLYGGVFSINFFCTSNSTSLLSFRNVYVSAFAEFSRESNFASFTEKDITRRTTLYDNESNEMIITDKTKKGYTGSSEYDYGFGSAMGLSAYIFPFKFPLGFFGEIKHQYVSFNNENVKDLQLSPLKLGLVFNLKNKETDKPKVALTLFMNRKDLSKHPTGDEDGNNKDLFFGLGVGLPISFK